MPQHGRGASLASWQQALTWLTRFFCSQKNVSCDKQQPQDWWSIHLQGPWDEKWLNQIVALIMARLSWISHKLQSSSVHKTHWPHHPNFSGGAKGESQHGLHFALRSFAYCTPWRMMTMPTNSTDWQRKGLCWSVNTFPPRRCQNYSSCQDTLWCKHVETNITEFGNRRFIVSYSMM